MSSAEVTRGLFRCDGAVVPPAWAGCSWDIERPIVTGGSGPNLDLKVEPLAAKVVGAISARAADLVRIAAYVYAADQMMSRGGPVDVHREGWRRHLALCVPVSDPAFWADPFRHEALQQTLSFLTDDEWAFVFDATDPEAVQLSLDLPGLPQEESPDAVVLFSGGTDSLCALVEHVAAGGRPLVVSHRSAPQLDRWQRDLLEDLRDKFQYWRFPQLSFWVQRRHGDAANSAQRSRAFLFAALGAAVAGQVGVPAVLLPDNGYVSLNPPINAQLVGTLASRSTHPKFVRLFNRVLDATFATPVQVSNPLVKRTRAEALGMLQPNGCANLLERTHSCGNHRGRTNAVPHCGGCSQCVDRRFSSIAAGLEIYDPAARYGLDVFVADLPEGEPRTIAESYVRFARATRYATDDDLFLEYPQLVDALDPHDDRLAEAGIGLTDLLRRHADEVLDVLGEMVGRYRQALARGELPAHSLLRLAVGSNGSATLQEQGAFAGREMELGSASSAANVDPAENAIERKHGVWHVRFRGTKGTYRHAVGLERLARLLAAPGQGISSLDLKIGPTGGAPTRGVGIVTAEYGLHLAVHGALGEVIDDQYERELKDRAKEVESLIALARERGNNDEAESLIDELEWINHQLRSATGLGGRRRKVADEHEAARKTVQKTIAAAIADFAQDMPELHAHLDRWVRPGLICRYDPDPPKRWKVSL